MKNIKKIIITTFGILFLAGAPVVLSFDTGMPTDVDSRELRTIIVESWEQAAGIWKVTGDPGGKQSIIETKLLDGAPKNLGLDSSNKKCLGIRFQFVYPGDNKLVITPPDDRSVKRSLQLLDDKTGEPKFETVPGIELPGIVKAMSIWVLGRGEEYTLEAWIEDGRGETHIFKFGNLNFVGWRPLTITIPGNVVQENDTFPQTKGLVLKKLVVRSTPKTKANKTVLAFDSLKVLTDMNQVFFDGADVNFDEADKADKEKMKKYLEQLKQRSQGNGETSAPPATK
ncbi:MAG: flagellar filament outer layer protein FlaA [Spirochaetia bacterium]|nr:flagellar filament outer layer protein FlaA [Spirochaetia bacterium]